MEILSQAEADRLQQIIGGYAGLRLDRLSLATLKAALQERQQQLRLDSAADYLHYLERDASQAEELPRLCAALTNKETFFFRESEHFTLLAGQILPAIARRARRKDKTVTLWSAGCSTGEEAYSLAMVAHEFRRQHGPFPLLVLGTDIDGQALEKARRGLYRQGALRRGGPGYLFDYLDKQGAYWQVQEQIRNSVTFRQHNLVNDPPLPETQEVDVIFCRNVLIYLDSPAMARLYRKFNATLCEGGYLFLSASETVAFERTAGEISRKERRRPTTTRLARVQVGNSFLFRKEPWRPKAAAPAVKRDETASVKLKTPHLRPRQAEQAPERKKEAPRPARQPAAPATPDYESALAAYGRGDYAQALEETARLLESEPGQVKAACLAALTQISLGDLERARATCHSLLESAPGLAEAHFLLGLADWHSGELDGAISQLRRAIFLQPSHTAAHFLLAECYKMSGQNARAEREYGNTLTILARGHDQALSPILLEWPPGYIEQACRANLRALNSTQR
jgi:chemotaxis protein methyltransferase CheR